jgi:site-specific recombinase XerD
MEGVKGLLDKLSIEDVQKLSLLFNINKNDSVNSNVTLRVFCDEYKKLIKNNCSYNYYKSVEVALSHLSKFFSEQEFISSIKQKDIEVFLINLQRYAPNGYRVYFRTLKAAFNKAVDWNYISTNPFTKIKLQKRQTLKPKIISKNELEKILDVIEVPVVRDVVEFAYHTGMRLNEIVNLKWENVDSNNKLIAVGDDEFVTKGKKQRFVPMSRELEKVIKDRMQNLELKIENEKQKRKNDYSVISLHRNDKQKYVFGKESGNTFTGDYFSKRFKRACRAAGIDEGIHFHSLRHSFASNMARGGVSLYVIKELLGHSSIKTTEIYAHLDVESLREAVEKINGK